tara:strand:+ start:85899 stop:86066 length:168 start_codon:yes stop_codon:yes gene_type:complete
LGLELTQNETELNSLKSYIDYTAFHFETIKTSVKTDIYTSYRLLLLAHALQLKSV